jgi:hypothetical protein
MVVKGLRKSGLNWYALLVVVLTLLLLQISIVTPVVTSLTTDKSEYLRGEAVTISGTASAGEWVAIQVKDPNGVNVWIDSVKAGSDGSFTSSFRLSSTATYGTYTVYATPGPGGQPVTKTFQVVTAPPPPPPPVKKSSSMTITLDKTSITLGESVTISGLLTPALNVTVDLEIKCPNGTSVSKSILASKGAFTYVFKPDVAGVWSFKASWKGNDEYYGCESSTVTLIARGAVSLRIFVAPLITSVRSIIIIYADTSPALVDRSLVISYTTNKTVNWITIGSFNTGSDGIVACLFTPTEVAEYKFKVEWIGDSIFMPASATSPGVLVIAESLTAQDIVNALNQLKALQKLLEEKEAELKASRDTISMLNSQIAGLQHDLSNAQSRISSLESQLAETQSRLAEAESRVMLIGILALIVGLLIGILVAYLILKRRGAK